jgi:hypothetical protein
MILSQRPENPFLISKLEVDGIDVSKHFASITLEESVLGAFPYGTLVLSREFLDYSDSWEEVELGFIGKILKFEWTTDVESGKSGKSVEFLVYGRSSEGRKSVSLLLVSPEAPYFYTKQFCDSWSEAALHSVVGDVLKNHAGVKSAAVSQATTKVTYANPLAWSPSNACRYLVPMMDGSDGCAYLLFSKTTDSGTKTQCVPVGTLLAGEPSEKISLHSKIPGEQKEVLSNLSTAAGYRLNPSMSNLLEQLRDCVLGVSVTEYDWRAGTASAQDINMVEKNIRVIGRKSGLTEMFEGPYRNSFYFAGLNGQTTEKSVAAYDYVRNNDVSVYVTGLSTRELGTVVYLDLYSEKGLLNDPRSELSGKSLVSKIRHVFTIDEYYQTLSCVKTGLGNWKKREAI